MKAAPAVLAALVGSAAVAAPVRGQDFRRCNHQQHLGANIRIGQDMELAWSDQGDGDPDVAVWDAPSVAAVGRAWRGHSDLDPANPRVFLGSAHTDHGFNSAGPDFVSLLHKHTGLPDDVAGSTAKFLFFDLISEVDVEVRGRTRDQVPELTLPVATRCAHDGQSFGGVMAHELGHGYGFGHWLDWISIMNPAHRDALSCDAAAVGGQMRLTPDALTTQCHDLQYGLPAGVDFSGTPVRQTCQLANGFGCASALANLTRYAPGTTFALVLAQFTSFSNRDSFAGGVGYRMVVSADLALDPSDREVGRGVLTGWGAGATLTRTLGGRMNPTADLPAAGQVYTLLIELDPDRLVAETRETNNVVDTQLRFVRD